MKDRQQSHLLGKAIAPGPIRPGMGARELIESTFLAYNSARLREACRLFVEKMLQPDVTVGMTLSGALTPAGLGRSCLIPLIESGMVDWIVSTGANLYHDTHFALGKQLHAGSPFVDDAQRGDYPLRRSGHRPDRSPGHRAGKGAGADRQRV